VIENIKNKLNLGQIKIDYVHMDLLRYVNLDQIQYPESVFYSISDILSFEDINYLKTFLNLLNDGGRSYIVWRSFVRNIMTAEDVGDMQSNFGNIDEIHQYDSTGMYRIYGLNIT
jgi:hypothetical protein